MDDIYKKYDEVVNTLYLNVVNERARVGKYLLYDFQEDQAMDRLYFNITAIAADLNHEAMYLDMPFFAYLHMKWLRRKVRKNLRYLWPWMRRRLPDEHKTSIYLIVDFVRGQLNLDSKIFEEINNEYYGWYEG